MSFKNDYRKRTGFNLPFGHYNFKRMPFGLSNSTSNFNRLIDVFFTNSFASNTLFLNDIIITKSVEEHAARLQNILERSDKANLQLHPWEVAITQPQ